MAVFYKEGEEKIRPGIYMRHTNIGYNPVAGAIDGICAIPIQASWGPLGKVIKITKKADLYNTYGSGDYTEGFTVPAAGAMFDGGANTVYTYRLGTGGTEAKATLKDTHVDSGVEAVTITAKYPGARAFTYTVRNKLGDKTKRELLIYDGTTVIESYTFAAGTSEAKALVEEAKDSENFTFAIASSYQGTEPLAAAANEAFTAGTDPSVTNENYSAAFAAFEPYFYNTIALDVDDDESLTLSLLLQAYKTNAYQMGKLGIAVVGETTAVDFEDRLEHSRSFDDEKVVYLGNGYVDATGAKIEGVMAICYTAGLIAAKPSNQSITHTIINGATDVTESLTYSQYEDAIRAGMLLLSVSSNGEVWYDSGINTLVSPATNEKDDGWKKIRRVKVRFEMIDRLDRELGPKVGRVNCDPDGVADVIQAGQRILDAMANENKIFAGGSFTEDPDNPHQADSAWFIIRADDIDSLEKIYLQYQFRYSQYA